MAAGRRAHPRYPAVGPRAVEVRGVHVTPTDLVDAAWVRLAGGLDSTTTPQLERALCEPRLQARLVVLDLRELTLIDSCGVHAIVDASLRARKLDRRLLLLAGPPAVDRVFTLTASTDDVVSSDIHPVRPGAHEARRRRSCGMNATAPVRGAAETVPNQPHLPLWVAVGLALPFGLGVALTGSVAGGLTGLLWGGAVRVFLLHHATFSINSLCHYFGRRPFATGDQSHNLAWLAPIAFGEAWHNNHHAFPTSARHGLGRRQLDPSAWLISALERCHLAWDVVRISPERQQGKRGSATA
jgi:anti-anti-sigma factor